MRHGLLILVVAASSVACGGALETESEFVYEPISFEEYEAAYLRFVACLRESGVGFFEYGFDPDQQAFLYATEGADDELEASTGTIPATACYEREFYDADVRWQAQVEAETFDERWQAALDCFAARGLGDVPGDILERRHLGALYIHAESAIGPQAISDFEDGLCP